MSVLSLTVVHLGILPCNLKYILYLFDPIEGTKQKLLLYREYLLKYFSSGQLSGPKLNNISRYLRNASFPILAANLQNESSADCSTRRKCSFIILIVDSILFVAILIHVDQLNYCDYEENNCTQTRYRKVFGDSSNEEFKFRSHFTSIKYVSEAIAFIKVPIILFFCLTIVTIFSCDGWLI